MTELEQSIKQVRKYLVDRHSDFECVQGRNRSVLVGKRFVIKIPLSLEGIVDNEWEAGITNGPHPLQGQYHIRYARTKVVVVADIPVVIMELVKDTSSKEIKKRMGYVPKWTDCVDSFQVGWNKFNCLVAYDYGIR